MFSRTSPSVADLFCAAIAIRYPQRLAFSLARRVSREVAKTATLSAGSASDYRPSVSDPGLTGWSFMRAALGDPCEKSTGYPVRRRRWRCRSCFEVRRAVRENAQSFSSLTSRDYLVRPVGPDWWLGGARRDARGTNPPACAPGAKVAPLGSPAPPGEGFHRRRTVCRRGGAQTKQFA